MEVMSFSKEFETTFHTPRKQFWQEESFIKDSQFLTHLLPHHRIKFNALNTDAHASPNYKVTPPST